MSWRPTVWGASTHFFRSSLRTFSIVLVPSPARCAYGFLQDSSKVVASPLGLLQLLVRTGCSRGVQAGAVRCTLLNQKALERVFITCDLARTM